jgi:lysyl-tRNA synthetase class I
MKKPCLSEAEFWGLFAKCDNCQKITTREVFRYHLEDCEGYQHEEGTDTEQEI